MATFAREPMVTDADLAAQLAVEPLTVTGRLRDSSNNALVADVRLDGSTRQVVYKPQAGERPLWDFPGAALGRREVAAYLLSAALGWNQVPLTVWRDDGPAGPGMCQLWVDGEGPEDTIDLFTPDSVPADWLAVLQGLDGAGNPVVLAHSASTPLQHLAVFDYLANNADRKAGHLISGLHDQGTALWAIDHGLTFHVEPKLRTVLWGFAGQDIPESIRVAVSALLADFGAFTCAASEHLDLPSLESLRLRAESLLEGGRFPQPTGEGPAVPWPIF